MLDWIQIEAGGFLVSKMKVFFENVFFSEECPNHKFEQEWVSSETEASRQRWC